MQSSWPKFRQTQLPCDLSSGAAIMVAESCTESVSCCKAEICDCSLYSPLWQLQTPIRGLRRQLALPVRLTCMLTAATHGAVLLEEQGGQDCVWEHLLWKALMWLFLAARAFKALCPTGLITSRWYTNSSFRNARLSWTILCSACKPHVAAHNDGHRAQ